MQLAFMVVKNVVNAAKNLVVIVKVMLPYLRFLTVLENHFMECDVKTYHGCCTQIVYEKF